MYRWSCTEWYGDSRRQGVQSTANFNPHTEAAGRAYREGPYFNVGRHGGVPVVRYRVILLALCTEERRRGKDKAPLGVWAQTMRLSDNNAATHLATPPQAGIRHPIRKVQSEKHGGEGTASQPVKELPTMTSESTVELKGDTTVLVHCNSGC